MLGWPGSSDMTSPHGPGSHVGSVRRRSRRKALPRNRGGLSPAREPGGALSRRQGKPIAPARDRPAPEGPPLLRAGESCQLAAGLPSAGTQVLWFGSYLAGAATPETGQVIAEVRGFVSVGPVPPLVPAQ